MLQRATVRLDCIRASVGQLVQHERAMNERKMRAEDAKHEAVEEAA